MIVLTVGAVGVGGCTLISILADAKEVHPSALVTVQKYVPATSPAIVEFVPVPVEVVPPGFLVNVHVPVAGSPLNSTLPVATEQVGCVIVPTVGADGVAGCTLMTMLVVAKDVHPSAFVTV